MRKQNIFKQGSCMALLFSLILSGCSLAPIDSGSESMSSLKEGEETASFAPEKEMQGKGLPPDGQSVRGLPFRYELNPETLSLALYHENTAVPVSRPGPSRKVEQISQNDANGSMSFYYPDEKISVSVSPTEDYLSLTVTSDAQEDIAFTWPHMSADTYYLPLGEGKRVPAENPAFQDYLDGQEFSVLEQLSMPFWAALQGEYAVVVILEDPFRTNMNFTAEPNIQFSVTHEYTALAENKSSRFRVYLTDSNPVNAAKIYRNYVVENEALVTLEQKAASNPNIRKLYGAPFLYLWGEFIISPEDISWPAFRTALGQPVISHLLSFSQEIENGQEFKTVLEEIRNQDYVSAYQKNVVCSYLSVLLKREDFWDASVFTGKNSALESLLKKGYGNLTPAEKIEANKYALSSSLPDVFGSAATFMDTETLDLIKQLEGSGIDRAWIGLNSWEQAFAKPELVREAVKKGYLIGSYDSYHSIHEPGKEQWITAKFEDTSLYEDATVSDKNGEKIKGFQNTGRKLNPLLSLPSVKDRMKKIMANDLPFNSWFIDCDATGEIYDDYSPEHVTAMEEDLKARLERMAWIRDTYQMVIGSEGGHDFAASTIAFAHGIELKSFSWMDPDMKENKESEYYIGKYYNPAGGVAEHFAKVIPLKEQYYTVFLDPRYDIPLFKLVYNNSVITSYHWDWSTFKIQGAVKDRMVREILFNVPPLYHLDAAEWETYREAIARHHAVWSPFSREAVLQEMTGFSYLAPDGSVQLTEYGSSLRVTANYGDAPFVYNGQEIPGHSALIEKDGTASVYTPTD